MSDLPNETDCVIAVAPCGCVRMWASDMTDRRTQRKIAGDGIARGYTVRRAVTADVRLNIKGCDKCQELAKFP